MHRAVLALGSNIGDRLARLQGAIDALPPHGVRVLAVSSVYETDPVGGPEQGAFLNAVAVVETVHSPRALLEACQAVEADHDRRREVRWGPRTLDIDLVAYDDVTDDDPVLTLPHPRAAERAFVCVPWSDVDPDGLLPQGRVADLATTLGTAGVTRRLDLALTLPLALPLDPGGER